MTIFPLWCSFTGVHLDSDCCVFMLTSEPKNSAASLRYALLNLKIDTTNPMSSLTPRWFPKLVLILHAHAGIKLIFTETHIDTHTHMTWHDMQTPSSHSNSIIYVSTVQILTWFGWCKAIIKDHRPQPAKVKDSGDYQPIGAKHGVFLWGPFEMAQHKYVTGAISPLQMAIYMGIVFVWHLANPK